MIDAWEAREAEKRRVRRLVGTAVALVVVGGFLALVDYVNNRPPPDETERFADVAPFVEFSAAGPAGWVGRVDETWAGLTDPAVADAACATLLLRLAPAGDQTVTVLGPDGLPARECVRQ